jgi:lysophospholipase L1-like esterase
VRTSRLICGTSLAAAAVLGVTAVAATAGTSSASTVRAGTARTGHAAAPALTHLAAASAVNYVALGDSYSSGDGAGDYDPASGSCDRSGQAYPEQYNMRDHPASFTSVACAGAQTSDVISGQVSALSTGTTLVSITIGGNDAGFSSVMETCVLESDSNCTGAVKNAENFIANTLPGRLNNTLQAIRTHAPSARVVVLDYPHLYDLSQSSGCLGLDTTKRTALNQGADALDTQISAAASRYGDVFADVRNQFSGHEICDSDSWLNSVTYPIGESYHPTAAGQVLGYLPVFTSAAG